MGWLDEFKKFIQRGNVIDLAVAVIIGAAFTAIVNSLVADVFTPLLGVATRGGEAFSGLDVTLYQGDVPAHDVKIKIGSLLKAVVNFFIVAFCVFWLVKGVNLIHKEEPRPAEMTTQEKLLTEIRDLLKGKQEAPTPPELPPPQI